MKEKLQYAKTSDLMSHFFNKILHYVNDNGKKAILWCELNGYYRGADQYLFPYPKDVTLVTWRNGLTPMCIQLTTQSNNLLILAPGEHCYLDYPQLKGDLPEFNNWGMPVTTLEKCYSFDPYYGNDAKELQHIQGTMVTLWGEAIKDINRVNYMSFPRALAIAEASWTTLPNRSWDSFKQRLYPNLLNLMKHGVSVRAPYEIGTR